MTDEIKRILEENGATEPATATREQATATITALLAESDRLSTVTRSGIEQLYRQADQLETRAAVARALRRA